MRPRECNLDLRLLPSTDCDHQHRMQEVLSGGSPGDHQQQPQELVIFYNGRVCVCHVTELQGRAILYLAKKEMEETLQKTPTSSSSHLSTTPTSTNFSMKRSLQCFLQKRKNRIQSASPYIINHPN